jgi:hypothetical protein
VRWWSAQSRRKGGAVMLDATQTVLCNGSRKLSDVRVPARITTALSRLMQAQRYAASTGRDAWDFAVEIGSLGLRANDLRWLIYTGCVEHGWENTRVGAKNRSFRRDMGVTFTSRSCFVATAAGLALAGSAQKTRATPMLC